MPPRPRFFLLLLLAALVAIGSWLRFDDLERDSLWTDEVFTAAIALYHPLVPEAGQPWYRAIKVREIDDGDTFLTAKAADQSPPLHDLFEKATVQALGPTEFAARLPAALAGCALLVFCAALAWRERDPLTRRVLAWTLLLLALWPALVVFAREGRAYSLGVSLFGIGLLLWLRRWRAGPAGWHPPGWGEVVALAGASLSHYLAVPGVLALAVADWRIARRTGSQDGKRRLKGLALLVLPWMLLHARTIHYTSRGRAGWGIQWSPWEWIVATVQGALDVLHTPWLLAGLTVAVLVTIARAQRGGTPEEGGALAVPLWQAGAALLALAAWEVALSGRMAASAGMAHSRYYLFAIPIVAVLLGLVFAQVRHPLLVAGLVALLVASVAPALRTNPWTAPEDFRGMTAHAVEGATPRMPILYAWRPNRDNYRVYLERMLGHDVRAQMVVTNFPEDAARACGQLGAAPHVAVLGHIMLRQRTDEVYAACGSRWPRRSVATFRNTYAERWDAAPPK